MSKVLIVTKGEYSDYDIVAVFLADQRKHANACVGLVGGDARIEEHELNPAEWMQAERWFRIAVFDDDHISVELDDGTACFASLRIRNGEAPRYDKDAEGWFVFARARTREKAQKIATDRVAKAKAERDGIA